MNNNDLVAYKVMPIWQQDTIPQGFMRPHNTQEGTFAQLKILEGAIDFALCDEFGTPSANYTFTKDAPPPLIKPQQWHQIVKASADVKCQLTFLCKDYDYLAKKYKLRRTHSEVIEAVKQISPCKTLDLGCGSGRNALYLALKNYEVEAWDANNLSLSELQNIAVQEKISKVQTKQVDLNQVQITDEYGFILSTVVLMFLQPESIRPLIAQMQQATLKNGYNLIVAAMDTPDFPCPMPFPFTFKPFELKNYYAGWNIIKYNEDVGQLHKVDENGDRIKLRFATLLAQKI